MSLSVVDRDTKGAKGHGQIICGPKGCQRRSSGQSVQFRSGTHLSRRSHPEHKSMCSFCNDLDDIYKLEEPCLI